MDLFHNLGSVLAYLLYELSCSVVLHGSLFVKRTQVQNISVEAAFNELADRLLVEKLITEIVSL